MFYSIERAYRFGFGQPCFLVKCLSKMCGCGVVLVVMGRKGVGVVPGKGAVFMWQVECAREKVRLICCSVELQMLRACLCQQAEDSISLILLVLG